jgi:dolichol-phosphate mannosyltransferase
LANGISVVIATFNEKENIEKTILSIRKVLQSIAHEVIVVDDGSQDGTIDIAVNFADLAISKRHEGQTISLLYGMRLAKYPIIVTIDADMENNPKYITTLAKQTSRFDIVVASRTKLPRISEKIASKTLGRMLGITDVFSNFRAYRKEIISMFDNEKGENFGSNFLMVAMKKRLKISEIMYEPSQRRSIPRIGGAFKANLRIFFVLFKLLIINKLSPLLKSKRNKFRFF